MQTDREVRYQTAAEIRQELDVILTTPRSVLIQQQQAAAEAAARATQAQKQAASGPQKPMASGPQKRMSEQPVRNAPPPFKKSSLGPVLGIAVLLVMGAAGYVLFSQKKPEPQAQAATPAASPPPAVPQGSSDSSRFAGVEFPRDLCLPDSTAWRFEGGDLVCADTKGGLYPAFVIPQEAKNGFECEVEFSMTPSMAKYAYLKVMFPTLKGWSSMQLFPDNVVTFANGGRQQRPVPLNDNQKHVLKLTYDANARLVILVDGAQHFDTRDEGSPKAPEWPGVKPGFVNIGAETKGGPPFRLHAIRLRPAGAPAPMPESATPTPSLAGTTDSTGFSHFAPTAQWRDELAGTDAWGPAWQLAGNEMHVVESNNAMRVFADLRQDSALRVRFRSQSDAAWLDLIQRLKKVGIGSRYVITLWTKEKLGGSLDILPLKKDGERRTLAPLKSQPPLGIGTEHTAELYAIGDRLTFFFDGQLLSEAQDTTFTEGFPGIMASKGIELIRVETAVLDPQSTNPPPTDVLTFGGHRYQFSPEKLNWEEAKAKAAAVGGHLATITSAEENQWVLDTFVSRLQGNLSVWLGGTKDNPTQTWTWITGEPLTFTAWGTGEPGTNLNEMALCFSRQSQGWGDIRTNGMGQADRRGGYLIEWDDAGSSMPAPVATAAPAPVVKAPNDSTGWTNLLASVDVGKNTLAGQWRIEGGELHCRDDPASHRTVEIPVEKIPVNYDLRCRLTRTRPGAALFFALRQGETGAGAVKIDSWTANKAKANEVSALLIQARGEGADAISDNRYFQPGQRRELIFQVREDSFKALLDGEELLNWKGSWSSLSQGDNSFLPPGDGGPLFALGVCGGEVVFHSLELREVDVIAGHKAALLAADPQLARLEAGFKARYDNDAQKPFLAALAALNQSYVANGIAKARAAAQAKGSLKDIIALDAEKARIEQSEGVPAEGATDTPDSLKALRDTYRSAFAKITAERDAKAAPLYDLYLKAVDAHIAELTKTEKLDEAKRVRALRDEIASLKPQIAAATQPLATARPAPTTPTKPASPTGSTWRIAAEFLVSNGGSFVASKNGVNSQILTAKDIPAGRFDIIELSIDRLNSVLPPLKSKDLLPLVGLRDLRRVWVRPSGSALSDEAFAFLAGNEELSWLNLEGVNDVTDEVLTYLASAKKLDYLGVQYATKFTGKGLDKLPCSETLTGLELLGCGISDDGLKAISAFKQLRILRITSGTALDKDFALLGGIKSLTNLTVSTTAFGNKAAEAIGGLTGLTRLDATGTKLTNSGLERLYPLKNLTELILNGTEVTPQAAADFQKALPQCRVSR
jgi:hypothetical protein